MNTVTKEQYAAMYGTQSLSQFQPLAPKPQSYTQRVASSFKTDLEKRVQTVSRIQGSDKSTFAKHAEGLGQAAGSIAHGLETAVSEIPGAKPVLNAVGSGFNALTNSAPIRKIGDTIGDSKTLQELTGLYDSNPDFKDTVDSVANIFRLGADVTVGGTGGKVVKAATPKVGLPSVGVPTLAKNVAKDITPNAERFVNSQVSKALELTAGDIKNINLSTGNEPGQFLARNNLIGGNVDDTVKNITAFKDTNYTQVRSEIGKVTKSYSPAQIPRFTDALKQIQKQVQDVPGLEKTAVEVDNLLNATKTHSLANVQRVKELMDEHFNLYKVTGDVQETAAKEGLANVRSDLKKFIEAQVKENTGADIKSLNNNVQTTRSLLDAIEERSTRGLTRSNISIGDFGTFGVATSIAGPVMGVAAVVAKRVMQSPSFALKMARMIDRFTDAQKLKFKQEIAAGKIPQELEDLYSSDSNLTSNRSSAVNGANTQDNTIQEPIITQRSNVIPETLPQAGQPARKGLLQRVREAGSFLKDNIGDESGKIKNPFAGDKNPTPEGVAANIGGEDIPLIRAYANDPSLDNLIKLEPFLRAANLDSVDLADLQRFLQEVIAAKNTL